jgi:phosphatidylglycerophosphatase A
MKVVKDKLLGVSFFIASCAYAGYFPVAPGTAGSAVGVLADRILVHTLTPWLHGAVILVVCLVGAAAADAVEKKTEGKDPSLVVVDELAGMLLAVYLISLSWLGLLVAFVVFRLFDIVKPFPCRQAEKLEGGVGIMADDLVAGLYTNLLLRLASVWWPALLAS